VDWFLVCPIYRERYKTLSVAEKICENLSPRGITELKLKTAPRVRCQIYIALNHRAIGFSRGTRANGEAGFTSRIYYRSAINCQRGRAGRRPSWFRSARITRLESPPRFRKRAATKWWRRGISQTRYFSLRERERERERDYAILVHTVIALLKLRHAHRRDFITSDPSDLTLLLTRHLTRASSQPRGDFNARFRGVD